MHGAWRTGESEGPGAQRCRDTLHATVAVPSCFNARDGKPRHSGGAHMATSLNHDVRTRGRGEPWRGMGGLPAAAGSPPTRRRALGETKKSPDIMM